MGTVFPLIFFFIFRKRSYLLLYASTLCLRIVLLSDSFLFVVVDVARYTSNYLSPTIYVFSENVAASMISAHQVHFANLFHARLFEYFSFKPCETLLLKRRHSSFIMYYICNQNHLKACYDDNEIFNKHLYILYESYY